MYELGYMAKRIIKRPDWLDAPIVREIYSVANCGSENFCDYIHFWKHNGFWLFDSPELIRTISTDNIDLTDTVLLYYRGHDTQYDADLKVWTEFNADENFQTAVSVPTTTRCLGYDIVTYSMQNAPECSPLSCNNLATTVEVNEFCLIDSLDSAIEQLENGGFNNSEPGPYRIMEVNIIE